jgi:asparagine synthase (glutamine-hydrolysing)
MCGINGFNFSEPDLIHKMNQSTKHRGPDSSGVFIDEHVSLGNNLLAIMEMPTDISVPFVSPDRNYAFTYNGEVYNFKELRRELQDLGDTFSTEGDTEVLFKGLIRHGEKFIEKLDGMFAFAFYNRRQGRLILARDRMGMKPLYYFVDKDRFIFSSELRGIFEHPIERILDMRGTAVFFSLGYVPGNRTLIQNIFKLPPGQYLSYDLKKQTFDLQKFAVRKELTTELFNPETMREKITLAVSEHTMGLRPFGLYLSGGLDSSIILHELAQHSREKIYSFTSRFDVENPKYHEDADLAQRLALEYGVKHHEILVTEQDFIDSIEPATIAIEEPRYNYSASAYWLAARRASQDITVVLNGSGGDELFMGYSKYQSSLDITRGLQRFPALAVNAWHSAKILLQKRLWVPLLRLDRTLDRWMYISNSGVPHGIIREQRLHLSHSELRQYLRNSGKLVLDSGDPDFENNIASFDRLWWLADEEFLRTDKLTMQFGMEGRFPLVASSIVEYAQRIPSNTKLSGEKTKVLMRTAYQDLLPEYILSKKKTGWQAPAGIWMGSKLRSVVHDVLSKTFYAETASLFNFDYIHSHFLKTHREMLPAEMNKFWPFVSFQIWAKNFGVKLP